MHLYQPLIEILHVFVDSAPVLTERHNISDIFIRSNYRHLNIRLICLCNIRRIGIIVRIIHHDRASVRFYYLIDYRRKCRDQIQVKFSFESLLDYLHMKHPEKSASETETKRYGALRFIRERGIV